jgi:class 3 adenylate cyclase/DNA-binding transcriptional MerR regulator
MNCLNNGELDMVEPENAEARFISSTTLLARTGISRATLNNYINMGMISPPIVRKPDDPASKARQIGYFRDTTVDTIERIRLYKKAGRAMKDIGSLLSVKNDDLSESHDAESPVDDPYTSEIECTSVEGREMLQGNNASSGDEIARYETYGGGIVATGDLPLSDHHLLKQGMPNLVSFSVLVAKLQDSVRIYAELPPEEYFALIRQIWECLENSFNRYYGSYAKRTRDGMFFYFLKDRDSKYLVNTIFCAMDVRKSMKKLNNEWKMKKGWFNELCLNIGINEGEEYFGTILSSTTEFIPMGDSDHYAAHLSDLAHFGSIWTTKNLMNRLTEEERKKIRYGIRRRQQERDILIENVFSRIMDLIPPDNSKAFTFLDIATLPVTEILNLR